MDVRDRMHSSDRRVRLTDDMPWHVSNPDADGVIYRYTVSAWMMLVVPLLVAVNAVVWGSIGLVVAVLTIIHAVAGLF